MVTQGRIVQFTPSESTAKKFKNAQLKSYAALVTQVHEDTVELTVYGVKEEVYCSKVPHVSVAEEGRSKWDFPAKVDFHKIEEGDNLVDISARYNNVPVAKIMEDNNLEDADHLPVGKLLRVTHG